MPTKINIVIVNNTYFFNLSSLSMKYFIAIFYTEERIFIPENRIPKMIKFAFLASEDKNFYNHYGVDIIAIFRAFITNIINLMKAIDLPKLSTPY